MAPGTQPAGPANKRKVTTQEYLAWLLVALVVLYCISARPGGYDPLHHNSKSDQQCGLPRQRRIATGNLSGRVAAAVVGSSSDFPDVGQRHCVAGKRGRPIRRNCGRIRPRTPDSTTTSFLIFSQV